MGALHLGQTPLTSCVPQSLQYCGGHLGHTPSTSSVPQMRQYSKQAQTVSSRGGLVAGRARVFDPDIANHSKNGRNIGVFAGLFTILFLTHGRKQGMILFVTNL